MKKLPWREQKQLDHHYGLSPELLRLPLERLELGSPKSTQQQQPSKRPIRSGSNPLLVTAAIDEAMRIQKRVKQIQAFNQYCRSRQNTQQSRPASKRKESQQLEKDLQALCNKLSTMEELIEQQRKRNDELRQKLQSQEFESRSLSRQVGKFTKPNSRGVVSTHRDTDHLNQSQALEEMDMKNGLDRRPRPGVSKRKSVDEKQRGHTQHQPAGGATDRNYGWNNEQLQLLNEQFEHLIMKQEASHTKQERAGIRNQLIQVSRRINELTNYKPRTYHF